MHNLLHIVNDVRRSRRPLDDISSFISENSYRHELKPIHTGYKPIEQYIKATLKRRTYEKATWPLGPREKEAVRSVISFKEKRRLVMQGRLDGVRYGVCNVKGLHFDSKRQQDCFCEVAQADGNGQHEIVHVKLDHFVQVHTGVRREDYAEGRYLHVIKNEEFYSTPVKASKLGIYLDQGITELHGMWPLSNFRRKLFRIPVKTAPTRRERHVLIPLLHTV